MVKTMNRHEEIDFPNLDVHIDVFRVTGKPTVVDVRMPKGLFSRDFSATDCVVEAGTVLTERERSEQRHSICNNLHVASLSLDILKRQVVDGDLDDIETTLRIAVESLRELEQLASHKDG